MNEYSNFIWAMTKAATMATTTLTRNSVQFADDRGNNPNDESGFLDNSFDRNHRGIAWEMKRQAREKRVKELEQNLDEAKTLSKSKLDNPYYDNSYQSNANAAQAKALDYLRDARSQIGGNQSPGFRNSYDNKYPPNDYNGIRQDNFESEMQSNLMKRTDQRYQNDAPAQNNKYQHSRKISQDESITYGKTPGVNRSNYRPSEELARMFKQEPPRNGELFGQWDNNTRGQRLKQDYNQYVSQEMERDREVNPRGKKKQTFEDGGFGPGSSNRQSINPYAHGLSLPNLKTNQRQYMQQQQEFAPKKSVQQEAYVNDLLDQIKEKEKEKQMKKYQKLMEDRQVLENANNYNPFGRPGAGAPLMNEYGDVNARRNRDASNAIYNTDQYASYNNFKNMNSQGAFQSPNNFYVQPGYQNSSRLANYGNHVMENNPGAVETMNDYSTTNDIASERRNMRFMNNPFVPTERTSQRDPIAETHQVPGIGIGYNQRDQQFWQKKQRVATDLAQAYQEQMADKKRRDYEEKMRKDAEERAIEDKVKKELQDIARAHAAEKEVNKQELSRINKSFDKLKDELELDNEGRRVRRKTNFLNKSGVTGSKKDLDDSTTHQSQLIGAKDYSNSHHAVGPIAEQEEEYSKSRILNDSILDKPTEKPAHQKKPSHFSPRKANPDPQYAGMELNITFKTAADERMYRLKKDVSARTSVLQEQATALRTEALAADLHKQDAMRELMRLRDQLKGERNIEDLRAREMYEYVSKSSVNRFSTNQYNLQNLDKPLDFPLRPREYTKIFNVNSDYEGYYANMRDDLDDGVSQFIPIKDTNFDLHLKANVLKPKEQRQSLKAPIKIEEEVVHEEPGKNEENATQQMKPESDNQISHRSLKGKESPKNLEHQEENKLLSQQKLPSHKEIKDEIKENPLQQANHNKTASSGNLLQNLAQQYVKEQFNAQPSSQELNQAEKNGNNADTKKTSKK